MLENKLIDVPIKYFNHIKEKSRYNHNYYSYEPLGVTNILYGASDDDCETTWYLLDLKNGDKKLIGYSDIKDNVETIFLL